MKIARSVDSDIVFVRPAINVKDMSPFKSEHAEGLDAAMLGEWEDLYRQATERQAAGDDSEALAVYRQDPERWRRLQMAGMARDFSWRQSASRYLDIYQNAIDARRVDKRAG